MIVFCFFPVSIACNFPSIPRELSQSLLFKPETLSFGDRTSRNPALYLSDPGRKTPKHPRANIARPEAPLEHTSYFCVSEDVTHIESVLRQVAEWAQWAHEAAVNYEDHYANQVFNHIFRGVDLHGRFDIASRYAHVMAEALNPTGRIDVYCDYDGRTCRGPFRGQTVARRFLGSDFYLVGGIIFDLLDVIPYHSPFQVRFFCDLPFVSLFPLTRRNILHNYSDPLPPSVLASSPFPYRAVTRPKLPKPKSFSSTLPNADSYTLHPLSIHAFIPILLRMSRGIHGSAHGRTVTLQRVRDHILCRISWSDWLTWLSK